LRLIVVSSGIVGASCAYAASSLGAEVVLGPPPAIDLEPFAPLAGRSGSR
jgi:glycine/D-amino acid oxidase-like deaminating enzyme